MTRVQREQRNFLTKANMQLARYASTLEQLTVSRERNRLARELHDTLAHTLTAVAVQLEAVDSAWDVAPDKARTLLHKSLAQTRSGLMETRRALQALRASPLEDLGLALAVRSLAEITARRSGLELELSVPPEVGNLSPDIEQGIYRVAQEAMENVVKHANASRICVALAQEEGKITLTVQDNGRGFDVETIEADGHYGVQGMRERAAMMGAQLTIQRGIHGGTEVQLVWDGGAGALNRGMHVL
jgi:signal transduction histidine kinase